MPRTQSASIFIDNGKLVSNEPICLRCGSMASPRGPLSISLQQVSSMNRMLAGTSLSSHSGSAFGSALELRRQEEASLELEAIAAVHELSYAVQSMSISEMLPRTSDMLFVNLTTAEGQPYCLELTRKGWRITSLRTDCMIGDFTRFELFTKYYDSLCSLMDTISPGYRERFSEKLALRLKLIENGEDSCPAPSSSYKSSFLNDCRNVSDSGSSRGSMMDKSLSVEKIDELDQETLFN